MGTVKKSSVKETSKKVKYPEGWEKAIADTEALLDDLKLRQIRARAALRIFQRNLAAGEPWLRPEERKQVTSQ